MTPDGDALAGFAPVPATGWTVLAEVPARDALSRVTRLRSTVLTMAGLIGVVLLIGIVLAARSLAFRREARRALIEREAHTRAILEAATDAFVSMDADGVISAWNASAESIFGWAEGEAIGRRLSATIVPEHLREAHDRGLAHFLSTGEGPVLNERIEIVGVRRNGEEFPVELAIWPVRSHRGWTFNAFVRDITDRKRAETQLAAARDQALEASTAKSDFLATMSHEIRTPMNGVIGLTGLLLDSPLTETQRHYAEGVRASGEALLGIINDILDFSKIEAGKLELETVNFNLDHAIEDVAALVAESARVKGLELVAYCRPEVPTAVRGDVGRLRQILLNFATNAIKFTESGEVVVRASLDADSRPERLLVHFEVVDTGIGLDRSLTDRLFEPFHQADASTTRRYGGTGLGLAICRRLADAMGGTVGVDSERGHGATFWLRLPLAIATEPFGPPGRATHSLEGRRMLVVDDNQTNRLVLASQLRAWDITADLAADAAQALVRLRDAASEGKPYDLALLDMAMPDLDGLDLARMVRADPALRSLPMVLLSSVTVEAEAAAAAGFVARLTKPVRLSSLYDALVRAVAPGSVDAASTPARSPALAVGSRGTLLIVEDHAINQDVARGIVAKLGYASDVAGDGAEALEALLRRDYDAVLMDCHMPEMDGFEATAAIRVRENGKRHVPIIAMTAGTLADDREKCLASGMDDYLSKPLHDRDLQAVLERWLGGPQSTVRQEHSGARAASATDDGDLDGAQFDGLRRLATASGDATFLPGFIDQFLAQAMNQVAEIRAADAKDDRATVLAVTHGLKGTSATTGARGVASACAALEEAAARNEADVSRHVELIGQAIERAAVVLTEAARSF